MHNNLTYLNMMDYMGGISAPEKKRAVKEIVYIFSKNKLDTSVNFIKYLVEKAYDEYHIKINDCSYAAWSVYIKSELITKVKDEVELFIKKRHKIKCCLIVSCKLVVLYKDFLERSLAPGGIGYLRAQKDFLRHI